MNPVLSRQLEMAVTTTSVARLSEIVTIEEITR